MRLWLGRHLLWRGRRLLGRVDHLELVRQIICSIEFIIMFLNRRLNTIFFDCGFKNRRWLCPFSQIS
jgi:hypothetical protein